MSLFYNKPLPVWNAPAVNNAYISAVSSPPVSLQGRGRLNRAAWQERETPIEGPQPQGFVIQGFDGSGQLVFRTFGSQPLSDPKKNKRS